VIAVPSIFFINMRKNHFFLVLVDRQLRVVNRQAVLDLESFRERVLYAFRDYVETSPHYRSELARRREHIREQIEATSRRMSEWFCLSNFDSWSYENLMTIYGELMKILSDIFYYRVSIVHYWNLDIPGIDD
jgi:hypothetical protein